MQVDQSTQLTSTNSPLAKSSKKPSLQVQNTSNIKDKEIMEEGAETQISKNANPIITNEAIASAAESPALQRALELLRSAGTQARKRKNMEEYNSEVIAPKSKGIKNKGATSSKAILATILEDDEMMLPIKSLEIDIKGKDEVEMLQENSSKKGKYFGS